MADIVAQELQLPAIRRGSDASGLLSPPRSPRRPPVSPPPSSSMLKLQQLGLELGPSRSTLSLHAPSYNSSIRTTPSDLDKPLPLEPPEIDRRASSVYSVSTTISNIIDMYGGHEVEDEIRVVNAHRAQAYRDTVAPLMARRYSGAESPPPFPLIINRSSGAESPPPLPNDLEDVMPSSMPSPSIYQDYSPPFTPDLPDMPPLPVPSPSNCPEMSPPLSPPISPADSKNAPSFAEFTRNLSQKRDDLASPLSAVDSEDYHRQMALAALAPPSPKESPNMHPVAFDGSGVYLPGPMSGTISHVVAPEMIPPPLDLTRASRSISPVTRQQRLQSEQENNSFEDFLRASAARKNSSIVSSTDKFNHYTPSATPEPPVPSAQRFTDDERHRIMSYASQKYPGMQTTQVLQQAPAQDRPKRASTTRSSMTKRASALVRAMSVRKPDTTSPSSSSPPNRQLTTDTIASATSFPPPTGGRKNLAIQPTSYQLYGEASWEKDDKKKRNRRDKRTSRESNKTDDGGEKEKKGFFEGAKHKLTRTASEKRREKLKNSIKLVGQTELRAPREDPRKWWE